MMLNTSLFLAWVTIAVLVIKFRVHIHVEVKSGSRRSKGLVDPKNGGRNGVLHPEMVKPRKAGGVHGGSAKPVGTVVPVVPEGGRSQAEAAEIIAGLVNLGCSKGQAKAAVARAVAQGPAEFEELLRRAIKEAA